VRASHGGGPPERKKIICCLKRANARKFQIILAQAIASGIEAFTAGDFLVPFCSYKKGQENHNP